MKINSSPQNNIKPVSGILLIGLGVVLTALNIFPGLGIRWALMWPVFLLLPGFALWTLWLKSSNRKRDAGLVIPGTILICLSLLFFFNMFMTVVFKLGTIWAWTAWAYTGSVSVALFVNWLVARDESETLKAAKIMAIVSVFIFFGVGAPLFVFTVVPWRWFSMFWPIFIVFFGILILAGETLKTRLYQDGKIFGKTRAEWKRWGQGLGSKIEKGVSGVFGDKRDE